MAIDTVGLQAILSSWQSLKLHFTISVILQQDDLLTLPARIIRDFVVVRDANLYVAEFSLRIKQPDNFAFSAMPDVDEATDRRKQFRYRLRGEDTVVRVRVYENPTTRERLSVVTFDYFRRTVLFLNGNVSLAELKLTLQRPCFFY